MSETIEIGVADGVQTLRIVRPDKRNALTCAMYRQLADALEAGDRDDAVIAHLIIGTDGLFTAGNDIQEFVAFTEQGEMAAELVRFLKTVPCVAKPLIAAVDGLAVGIGTTLLLHCDLVYATPEARFQTPFVDLGLLPEFGSSLIGPRIMGPARAFELLCLGAPFDAARAREAGLVNGIVEAGSLEATAREAAVALARKPPQALATARRMLRGDLDDVLARIDAEVEAFKVCLSGPEAKEAFAAFLEKRAPDFARARAEAGES